MDVVVFFVATFVVLSNAQTGIVYPSQMTFKEWSIIPVGFAQRSDAGVTFYFNSTHMQFDIEVNVFERPAGLDNSMQLQNVTFEFSRGQTMNFGWVFNGTLGPGVRETKLWYKDSDEYAVGYVQHGQYDNAHGYGSPRMDPVWFWTDANEVDSLGNTTLTVVILDNLNYAAIPMWIDSGYGVQLKTEIPKYNEPTVYCRWLNGGGCQIGNYNQCVRFQYENGTDDHTSTVCTNTTNPVIVDLTTPVATTTETPTTTTPATSLSDTETSTTEAGVITGPTAEPTLADEFYTGSDSAGVFIAVLLIVSMVVCASAYAAITIKRAQPRWRIMSEVVDLEDIDQ